MSRSKYSDLVDVSKLQTLMESFSDVIGIANAVIDVEGNVITHAGWQDACTGFHRANAETCRRCIESDTSLVNSMMQSKPFAVYRCLNGLVDTAAPIIVAGEHVANVFAGQFLTDPPDLEVFRQQAIRFGFDETRYLNAIAKVPVLPAERVESVTRLYAQLAGMLADNGLDRINEKDSAEKLAALNRSLEETVAARTQALLRVNEDLAEREALLNGILDTTSVAIFLIDNAARITKANQRTAQMYGYALNELLEMKYYDLVHTSEREAARHHLLRISDNQSVSFDLERRYLRADQSEFWGRITASVLYDASGQRVGLVAVIADITARKEAEETLHQSEQRLRLALNAANQAWFDVDLQSGRVTVSPEYPRMIGYEPDEFQTDLPTWLANVHPDDREKLTAAFQACVKEGGPSSMEYRRQTKAGDWKWIQSVGKIAQRDAQQRAIRMIGIHTDITGRKQSEDALRDSEARFHRMFEHNGSVMLLIDPASGGIIDANAAAACFYGYSVEHLKTMRIDQINTLSSSEIAAKRNQATNHQCNIFEFSHRLASGEVRTVEVRSSPFEVGGRDLLFSIINDITERKQMEGRVRQMAFYDPLTRLPNRRLLHDRLNQSMAANKRSGCYGALMFIDLDNFKPLNDAHGHEVGYLLLIEAANRLKSCVREMDTVARFGGDEFVVMLSELSPDKAESTSQAMFVAEKIRGILAEPYLLTVEHHGKKDISIEHRCTASLGVVLFMNNEASQDDLIKFADKAMYQAKEAGRNLTLFFAPQA